MTSSEGLEVKSDELIYRGERLPDGTVNVTVGYADHVRVPVDWETTLEIENHSPTGPEWGYAGSGPAQLALAILYDLLGNDEAAAALHQAFKFRFVGRFPHDRWELREGEILEWIEQVRAGREARSS